MSNSGVRADREFVRPHVGECGDPDPMVRWAAVAALGALEAVDAEVISTLRSACADSDAMVRKTAAAALARLGLSARLVEPRKAATSRITPSSSPAKAASGDSQLDAAIMDILAHSTTPLKAASIAAACAKKLSKATSRRDVNQRLYGRLNGRVDVDQHHQWQSVSTAAKD
jgi:HEAT repeat protein